MTFYVFYNSGMLCSSVHLASLPFPCGKRSNSVRCFGGEGGFSGARETELLGLTVGESAGEREIRGHGCAPYFCPSFCCCRMHAELRQQLRQLRNLQRLVRRPLAQAQDKPTGTPL